MTRVLALSGIAGSIGFLAAVLADGALRPDYDPYRHQVSLLLLTDRGRIESVVFVASGVLIMAFATVLRRAHLSGARSVGGAAAVALAGVGLVVAGLFPPDPGFGYPPGAPAGLGEPVSTTAYAHLLGAMLLFFGLGLASLAFGRRLAHARQPMWAVFSTLSGIAVILFLGASSGGPDGQFLPAHVGVLQRVSLVAGLGWTAVLAARVAREA
jgi:hypothetical membrane protein